MASSAEKFCRYAECRVVNPARAKFCRMCGRAFSGHFVFDFVDSATASQQEEQNLARAGGKQKQNPASASGQEEPDNERGVVDDLALRIGFVNDSSSSHGGDGVSHLGFNDSQYSWQEERNPFLARLQKMQNPSRAGGQ